MFLTLLLLIIVLINNRYQLTLHPVTAISMSCQKENKRMVNYLPKTTSQMITKTKDLNILTVISHGETSNMKRTTVKHVTGHSIHY